MKKATRCAVPLLLTLAALIAACGSKPSQEAQPAQPSGDSFIISGNYELHYNALRTDRLSAEVAKSYGIERSTNKVMLNVAVLRKDEGTPSRAIDADIAVNANNLNGQVKDLQLRRIAEGEAIYYIGDMGISGNEIIVFEISAKPTGEAAAITTKFNREFYAD